MINLYKIEKEYGAQSLILIKNHFFHTILWASLMKIWIFKIFSYKNFSSASTTNPPREKEF